MNADQKFLAKFGAALYGPRFQRDLADDLNVNERTVRRWLAGSPIPAGIWPEVSAILLRRMHLLTDLARDIAKRS